MFVANLLARGAKLAKSNPLKPQVEVGILGLSNVRQSQSITYNNITAHIGMVTQNTTQTSGMFQGMGIKYIHNWRDVRPQDFDSLLKIYHTCNLGT